MISCLKLWATKLNDLFCLGLTTSSLIKLLKSTRPFIYFFFFFNFLLLFFFFLFELFDLLKVFFYSLLCFFCFFTYFININLVFSFSFWCFNFVLVILVVVFLFWFLPLILVFLVLFLGEQSAIFWCNFFGVFCLISSPWLTSSILSLFYIFLIPLFLFSSSALLSITIFFHFPFQYNMYQNLCCI